MMAVDSKQGSTTNAPPPGKPLSPAATLAGMPALSANGAAGKRRRPSSLMAAASAVPSVENSLDEFIAKANETLIDPSTFNSEQVRQEEDIKRKEHDALRWKATEQQMRESEAREQSLRRQLDGLQGKLAEAEARAAVAGSGGSQDGIIADLKLRLTMADEKVRTSEEKLRLTEVKVSKLEQEVVTAKSAAPVASGFGGDSMVGIGDADAEERVRFAEAKAAKAIAAARAAAAGLTVSPADIAAIESGLAVSTMEPTKKPSWGGMVAAFIVGGAIMFAVAFVVLKEDKKPAASAAGVQPAAEKQQPQAAPAAPEAPAKPTVTPIVDDKAAADDTKAVAEDTKAEDTKAEDTKAEDTKAEDAAAEKAAAAAAAKAEAAAAKAEAAAAKKPAKKAAPKKAAKAAKTEKKASAIADPFGDSSAPAPKKKEKKAGGGGGGGGIVDPF